MTKELEKALRHIKTRADLWAVREVEQALSQEPCEKCAMNGSNSKYCDNCGQKSGKWILTIEDWNKWTCSKCGYVKRTDIHVNIGWNYCPNCGARMESETETWNGIHGQITAPKGTFKKIFDDAESEDKE